jgi:predicted Zn-dependent protease
MRELQPPDSHVLQATVGWLELGAPHEALSELQSLSEENRGHPDVLEVQWLIQAAQKDWSAAVSTANQLVQNAPERPAGWLHRAYAVRRAEGGGLQQAWDLLLPAARKFPKECVIPYNLACYACQLGQLADSRRWFEMAQRAGEPDTLKRMALEDEDLRPLWDEIRGS